MARFVWFLVVGALAFYIVLYGPSHFLKAVPVVASSPLVQHVSASRLEAASQASSILIQSAERMTPRWETIEPKSKDECLKSSGGALNPVFVRCHYGYQEYVTYDSQGNRKVIQERSIPMNLPR